jgi:hypothetical protein
MDVQSVINNRLYTKKINLNLPDITKSANTLNDLILKKFDPNNELELVNWVQLSVVKKQPWPKTTNLFHLYNLLMYPLPEIHELHKEIKEFFYQVNPNTKNKHYIQCWLNIYNKGDYLDWHGHWPQPDAWHGFYCVNVEPNSSTEYKIPGLDKNVTVNSLNNLLVIGRGNDSHRTSEWIDDTPRITIAFDIVPRKFIPYDKWLNHWIPI